MEQELLVIVAAIVALLSAGLGFLLKGREASNVDQSSATVMAGKESGEDATRLEQAVLLHAIATSGVTSVDELAIGLRLTPSEVRKRVDQLMKLDVVELEENGQVRLKDRRSKRQGG